MNRPYTSKIIAAIEQRTGEEFIKHQFLMPQIEQIVSTLEKMEMLSSKINVTPSSENLKTFALYENTLTSQFASIGLNYANFR